MNCAGLRVLIHKRCSSHWDTELYQNAMAGPVDCDSMKRASGVWGSLPSRLQFSRQNLGMSVNRRHETNPHGPSDRLCNPSLVDRSKTSLLSAFDAAQRCHVLGHHGKVLCPYQRQEQMILKGRAESQTVESAPRSRSRTLYRSKGFMSKASKASLDGLFRFPHFFISVGLRSLGA